MKKRKTIRGTCLGCIGNCGAIYEVENNKIVKVKGDPNHPLSKGYICPRGAAVEDIRSNPERLTHPLKRKGNRGEGKWDYISWEEAIDEIAERLSKTKKEFGAEAISMAVGFSGILAGLDPLIGKFLHLLGSHNRLVDLHN